MTNKHCEWCDSQFHPKLNYQIYCSAECRESATREKIAKRYLVERVKARVGKKRLCRSCNAQLSIYNDDVLCKSCEINPKDVSKALKEIKGLSNEDK
jgi:hypothetical protein